MHDLDRYPPEAVLLAELVRLGQAARQLLARSHLTALLDEERQTPAHKPTPAPRLPAAPTEGIEAPKSPPEKSPPQNGRHLPPPFDHIEAAARALVEFWSNRPAVSALQRYGEDVDVTSASGRWELLALAILLGAPVRREGAEETFCELRRQGLLELRVVTEAPPSWRVAVDAVMVRRYRGPVNRALQRDRLSKAARTLDERWGGDLDALYREAGQRPEQAVALLRREFEGIDRLAAWLVREMGRLGAWPRAHRHPAAFFADPFLREAAANLGMAAGDDHQQPRGQEAWLRSVVERYFEWDSTVLSSHGREFCHTRNTGVCLSRCPVARYCKAWASWRKPDTGKEAGGRSTGS